MEELLQTKLIHEMPVHNVFGSVKEMNDFSVQMEKPAFNQFIDENAADFLQLKAPYGAFTVKNAGWLNIPIMLERFAGYLKKSQHYLVEHVDYNEIILSEQSVQYKNYISAGIIFCEGYKYHLNPFFQGLVYEPTKGDVLTIRCKYLPKDLILKKGIYLVYLGNDMYKVGATYDRKNITERPDPEAKEQLITDLQNMLNVPFEVIKHESGIRPTMRGRKPFVLQHGKHMNLFMMNGLGSKGVMFAPYFANILVKTILDYEATLDDNRGFE
jgi:glycine/D-amino acid oxidase-like deaminating enzyme